MRSPAIIALGLALVASAEARAQPSAPGYAAEAPPPSEFEKAIGLRTDVPEAMDFVRQTRPAAPTLEFASPHYGPDKVRPSPRDPAGVEALTRSLEAVGARNRAHARTTSSAAGKASPARSGTPR